MRTTREIEYEIDSRSCCTCDNEDGGNCVYYDPDRDDRIEALEAEMLEAMAEEKRR